MNTLQDCDWRAGFELLQAVAESGDGVDALVRAAVDALPGLVASEVTSRDFSDRDRDLLNLVGGPLSRLYLKAWALDRVPPVLAAQPPAADGPRLQASGATPREAEVLSWLAAGKTDREIAALLGCSHRTVQKHLQRLYVKLGVETRTAAVMRCFGRAAPLTRHGAVPTLTQSCVWPSAQILPKMTNRVYHGAGNDQQRPRKPLEWRQCYGQPESGRSGRGARHR